MTPRLRPTLNIFSAMLVLVLGIFALNFLWEMAQASFFSSMKGLPFWAATWLCSRAAAADVVLLALCFVVAAIVARDAAWPLHPTPRAIVTFFVACQLVTIGIERWAIATGRWRYGGDMPLILGVGALPLLQWILIPALSLIAFRLAFRMTFRGSGFGNPSMRLNRG